MAQFSMKIMRLSGSLLSGNQQAEAKSTARQVAGRSRAGRREAPRGHGQHRPPGALCAPEALAITERLPRAGRHAGGASGKIERRTARRGRARHRPARRQVGGPLLIIAGAGSGKTNTLAHRVAQLIISGADPRRILLMTFSRRAAPRWASASSASAPRCSATRRHPDRRACLVRHVPWHRRAAPARICDRARPRSAIHHP
jgi:hypothetical protein